MGVSGVGAARIGAEPTLLAAMGRRGEEARAMKKLLLACLVTLCYLAAVSTAAAHPLGNFTINRFSRVQPADGRIYVHYVLDLAEIPTFQARRRGADAGEYARRVARGVHLRVNGRVAPLVPVARRLAF